MALNMGIHLDVFPGWQTLGKRHFVVMIGNAIVAETANPDALV